MISITITMETEDLTLANKYQQKTDKQHILDNPDTYVGSIEDVDAQLWILSEDGAKILVIYRHYSNCLMKVL
jgi:hypothetical protein